MNITNNQIQFEDELCTTLEQEKLKGYYLQENQLVLQVENQNKTISIVSLLYTSEQQAYSDYLSLVNLHVSRMCAPKGYKTS